MVVAAAVESVRVHSEREVNVRDFNCRTWSPVTSGRCMNGTEGLLWLIDGDICTHMSALNTNYIRQYMRVHTKQMEGMGEGVKKGIRGWGDEWGSAWSVWRHELKAGYSD